MRFGPVPLEQAEGAILAHSVGLKRGRLRKGITLGAGDIAKLAASGHAEVTVARLDPGDIDENRAAGRLAAAVAGDLARSRLRLGMAATGRVNIFAGCAGVAEVDAAKIDAANAIDPMITIATVPRWQRMAAGGMVATVKIIAYGVAGTALARACETAKAALRIRPAEFGRAALIQTTVGGAGDGAKGHQALARRLDALGVTLGASTVVPHGIDPLARALATAEGDILFVLTGSATSDTRDVAPEAVRRAGGEIDHFGMPVDPGNLLFLGRLGGRPVIGLPGCARSPALNGADWVLERVICGVPVGPADIMGLGVGGLLKEVRARGHPREKP